MASKEGIQYKSYYHELESIAFKARKILVEGFGINDFTISYKDKEGVDIVTSIDTASNNIIANALRKLFPHDLILSEEGKQGDFGKFRDEENVWIVDPLDGTKNYSRGDSHYAISIARVQKGKTDIGLVHIPMSRFLGGVKETYYADRKIRGIVSPRGDLHVSQTKDLKQAIIGIDLPYSPDLRLIVPEWYRKIVNKVGAIKQRGSSVSDLTSLARGEIDVYLHPELKPWDVAGASLLIEKAGGQITTTKGDEWNVFEPSIVASNGVLHEQILDLING